MKQKLLIQLAMVIAACVFLCGTVSSAGEASPAEIESDSPLNEENLATILDNRGKFTESDLMTMLGPPSSIEKYDSLSITLMNWEEVNRIEVKCRQGVVETVSGTFSPRLPSRIINDSAFKRLRPGMKANDVLREVFFGWQARIVRDSSAGTDTLVFEQFNRFHILLSDGKVRTATRVWQTDEHLNTPIVRNPPVAGQTEEAAVIRELRAAGNQFKVKDNAERSEGISRDDQIHFLRFSTVKSLAPLATHARNLTDLNVLTIFGDADLSDLTELPALRQLHLEDCNADLSVLPKLPHLRFLHLNNVKPRDFSFLAGLPQLVTLTIHENEFSDLSPVAKLTKLTSLSIAESQVNDLAPVAGLRNLDTFNAYRAPVRDLTPLARLHSLERLGLFGTKVEDLTPLAELTNLYWLSLGRTQVRDLSLLARWPKMKGLNLQQIPATDFSVLATLTNLEELDLEETQIEDLSPLKELVKLKSLKLARVPARDVSPLAGLVNLAYLSVPEVRDVSSLTGLKKLRGLSLAGTVSDPEVAKLQAALPRCRINRIGK